MPDALRAFRHRNFRLFFSGQLASTLGTWMQMMAQTWLVYRLTKSGLLLGLVNLAGQLPALAFGLLGGVAADHFDRRRLLLWAQCAALAQAAALGLLAVTGLVEVWHVFVLAIALGLINVVHMPARQSLLSELVERRDLPNAIALNTVVLNLSRLFGPSLAGVLVAAWGEGLVFLLNAGTQIPSIAALASLRLAERPPKPAPSLGEAWRRMVDGVKYAREDADRRSMLTMLTLISFFGAPFMILIPIFAERLGYGALGVGWLMGASGVGALAASSWLATRPDVEGLRGVAGGSAALFGLALVVFSASSSMALSLAAMAATGAGMMAAFVACNMMLQSRASDELRGRLMALFSMTFMGVAPIGGLFAGFAADRVGAPLTLGAGGTACVAAAAWFLRGTRR